MPLTPATLFGRVRDVQRTMAPWPYAELDVEALKATGWRPKPFSEVILKVHQRCNLACDYCYVYEHADQSWRDRPPAMPGEVRDAAIARIAAHAGRHGLKDLRVVLHGGEPMLYGIDRLTTLAESLRRAVPPGCHVEIGMQTNGVLLTEATVRALVAHRIRVGISLDGTAAAHDQHRRFKDGRGSFSAVARGIDLLRRPEYRNSYSGLLTTVNVNTDPELGYQQLMAFEPPAMDLLLPHATWSDPPPRPMGAPSYAEWLIAFFDRWYADQSPTRVRLFESAIRVLLGGRSDSEQLGLSPSGAIVIESDGDIEQVDALKVAYPGAAATGLNVRTDDLDAALDDPGVVARQIGRAALADECRACPLVEACGGGHYVHRYRAGAGFRSPSVYCTDLDVFVRHVQRTVSADLRRRRSVDGS
ncbi:uncharacterized protein FB565_004392 [Actinoplanes lutulentus]|uniref:FxsB family cyclophane-forming radical SAM/SPASM peptide maturase n=1 Tax=Actinoplanes lutulentus TaxID=1287878 RepID=UPI0017E6D2AB|nr:FxsB family cyclophane-forming radical SAM/SPASM peptide maturase [Actinoplanes lutulentus]MBB2944659.1 uncharacterized protein [Actinoplanes lutulentus]